VESKQYKCWKQNSNAVRKLIDGRHASISNLIKQSFMVCIPLYERNCSSFIGLVLQKIYQVFMTFSSYTRICKKWEYYAIISCHVLSERNGGKCRIKKKKGWWYCYGFRWMICSVGALKIYGMIWWRVMIMATIGLRSGKNQEWLKQWRFQKHQFTYCNNKQW